MANMGKRLKVKGARLMDLYKALRQGSPELVEGLRVSGIIVTY
jgi:hypothetical protein